MQSVTLEVSSPYGYVSRVSSTWIITLCREPPSQPHDAADAIPLESAKILVAMSNGQREGPERSQAAHLFRHLHIYFRKIHPTETRSFPPTPLKWCVGYSFESSRIGYHATPLYTASLGKIA